MFSIYSNFCIKRFDISNYEVDWPYPYGTSVVKVCETELLKYVNIKWLILMIKKTEIKQNIISSSHLFQVIHTEY